MITMQKLKELDGSFGLHVRFFFAVNRKCAQFKEKKKFDDSSGLVCSHKLNGYHVFNILLTHTLRSEHCAQFSFMVTLLVIVRIPLKYSNQFPA